MEGFWPGDNCRIIAVTNTTAASLTDQTPDQSWVKIFLLRLTIVCGCSFGFSSIQQLPGEAIWGSLKFHRRKVSGFQGAAMPQFLKSNYFRVTFGRFMENYAIITIDKQSGCKRETLSGLGSVGWRRKSGF